MTSLTTYARAKRRAGLLVLEQLRVPVADPATGIIKIADLLADVEVLVAKTADWKVTDSIQLYWDGVAYGTPLDLAPIADDPAITEVTLPIAVADFPANGTDTRVVLDYQIFDTASEDGQFSNLPVTVRFDRRAPGGSHLPPIFFTEEQHSGITLADLVADLLELTVEPFFDSDTGDIIELWLGTSATVGVYLTPTFVINDPAVEHPVTITKDDLSVTPDGTKYFGYRVTDFAGNISGLSELVAIPVFLTLQTPPAPEVPEAVDLLITYNDALPDVEVIIPNFAGLIPGDSIYVVWGAQTNAPYVVPGTIPSPPDPIASILVPYALVAAEGDGINKLVSYWVQRTGAPRIDSATTPVNVDLRTPGGPDPDPDPETPEHENIRAPEVQCGTSPVNTIGTGDYGRNATATIFRVGVDLNPIWAVGDVIQLYWGTVSAPELPPVPVTLANQGANIAIPVPFTGVIEDVGVADVDVYFTLTRILDGTNSVTVKSQVQVVPVRSTGELPNDGTPINTAEFPERNASNVITRARGIDGTTVEVDLASISNIELSRSPFISYEFVGLNSVDSPTPIGSPIDASRLTADNVAITQAMLDAGRFILPLPYSLTFFICRNGATFNYTIGNAVGTVGGTQVFVRFAMNQGGGTCSTP